MNLAAMALLAACSDLGEPPAAKDASATAEAAESPAADASPAEETSSAPAAERFAEKSGDGSWSFEYIWPAKVSARPPLAETLLAERTRLHGELRADWDAAQADAMPDCLACRSIAFRKEWQVVADLPRFLSLSATVYTYTGGAHGMTVFDALVWDRESGEAVKPISMFRSAEAIDAAVRGVFCDALDKARRKKRDEPIKRGDNPFNECIAPVANSTVILGSSGGKLFDRVGFLIPPYNAGPYAEGTYEVTLPVTPALLDAVRFEYRRAFQVP